MLPAHTDISWQGRAGVALLFRGTIPGTAATWEPVPQTPLSHSSPSSPGGSPS